MMESINENFHEIYSVQYKLEPYKAKPPPFSARELLEFSRQQHEWLSAKKESQQQPVIFLVREVDQGVIDRYTRVAAGLAEGTQVFLITDKWWPRNQEGPLNIVYMYENFCFDAGFFYVNTDVMPNKLVITWDRCLFFMSQYKHLFEYAWILEDDVALKGLDTLARFMAKYAGSDADLLAAPPLINKANPGEWILWKTIEPAGFPLRWASYNPVCRLSRRFIEVLTEFVRKKRRMFFLEIFFYSLALNSGLKTQYFHELERHFRFTPNITFEETQRPGIEFPIFHPVKDLALWNEIWNSSAVPTARL
jgi:hypothetical protein